MASVTQDQAARDQIRKEKRNLARRKCSYDREQREKALDELVSAKAKAADVIECARINARKVEREASEAALRVEREASEAALNILMAARSKAITDADEAASMKALYEEDCAKLRERSEALHESIRVQEEKMILLEEALSNHPLEPSTRTLRESEASRREINASKRESEAVRKRRAYWKSKESASFRCRYDPAGDSGSPNSNRKGRSVSRAVSLAVENVFQLMSRFNDSAKRQFFKQFWLHRSLKRFHPTRFGTVKCDASVTSAVSDLKQALRVIKFARRKDHLATKHAVLTTLVGQATVGSRYQSSLAKALGIKRQNMVKASKRRECIDNDESVRYPMGERKVRCDRISNEVRKIVEGYWEANTRISPCTKDKARKRLAKKDYEEHRVHWLEDTEVEFFMNFQEWCVREGNGVAIGLRSFQYLKPYYIRTMKDRMVCCCKQHVQMDMLKEAMNKFSMHQHSKDCTCPCPTCRPSDVPSQSCVHSQTHITSVRGWLNGALCPIAENSQWHRKKCLMGRCSKCGVEKLKWCQTDLDPIRKQLIDWQTFQYVELDEKVQQKREKKKGTDESARKKVKRLRMVYERKPMADFKKHVLGTMKEFIVHNFRARWQSEQFKLCLKTFPRGTVVSSIDFSENYTFKPQNEIQSQHWDNRQVTLLIHVTYRHRQDAVESMESVVGRSVALAQDEERSRDIIADYHFYISDDNQHDTLFVQHCLDLHNQWMKDQAIHFDEHWVWSDGAASQFKSCRPFYYVSRYFNRFGARMKWFFHASGHGKGVADALGGHIKQGIEREQRKGIHGCILEHARDVIEFCREKFALGQEKEYGDVQLVRRLFWEIPVGAVNRTKKWDCDPIKGSRSLHCFDGFSRISSTLLQVRELCCFCPSCVDDNAKSCENVRWTGRYKLQMVKGVRPADVRAEVQSMGVGEGGEEWGEAWEEGFLAELIQIGDFYAVEAAKPNKWEADFYISQCEEAVHTVWKDFVDGYDVAFKKGDLVLKGRWFQPMPGREFKFVFNDTAPFGYTLAKSVVHIRFGLTPCEVGKGGKGGARVYSLDSDTQAAIYDSFDS